MSSRREFLKAGGAAVLTASFGGCTVVEESSARRPPPAPRPGGPVVPARAASNRLRTITYNVRQCRGFPIDDRTRARITAAAPDMAARFAAELAAHDADIISFQECPAEAVVASIATRLGMNHCCFPSPARWPGAILTRHRIVRSDNCPLAGPGSRPAELFTRHFGRAVLDTGEDEVVVYSVHLYPGGQEKEKRRTEVRRIIAAMDPDLKSQRSLLLQGDLNHQDHDPEYALWREAGLVDVAVAGGAVPQRTFESTRPRFRFDYIMAHGPLAARPSTCRTLHEGAFRTDPDDPTSFALSDHIPVMATFTGSA